MLGSIKKKLSEMVTIGMYFLQLLLGHKGTFPMQKQKNPRTIF